MHAPKTYAHVINAAMKEEQTRALWPFSAALKNSKSMKTTALKTIQNNWL